MAFLSMKNEKKFNQIYESYASPLYYYIKGILKNKELSENALQETFIRILKNLDKVNDVSSIEARNYVYKIAHNTALTELKKVNDNVTKPFDDEVLIVVDEKMMATTISSAELSEEMETAIALLKPIDEEVLTLKYIDDWDDITISKHLEITQEAVRKRIQRAKLKLASIILRLRIGSGDNEEK